MLTWLVKKASHGVMPFGSCTGQSDVIKPSSWRKTKRPEASSHRDEEVSSIDAYDAMRTSTTQTHGSPGSMTPVKLISEEHVRVAGKHQPPVRYPSSLYEQFLNIRHYSPRKRKSSHADQVVKFSEQEEEKQEEPCGRTFSLFSPKLSLNDNRLSVGSETDEEVETEKEIDQVTSTFEDITFEDITFEPSYSRTQILEGFSEFQQRFRVCYVASLVMAPFASVRGNIKLAKYIHNRRFLRMRPVREAAQKISQFFFEELNDSPSELLWHLAVTRERIHMLDDSQCEQLFHLMWHNSDLFLAVDSYLTRRRYRKRIWREIRKYKGRTKSTNLGRTREMTIRLANLRRDGPSVEQTPIQ